MDTAIIVIGDLHTDIIAAGVSRFPDPGELVYGKELKIGPGGKPRNIADMAAQLSSGGKVAMIARTAQDKYGLWRLPVDALIKSGVNVEFVKIIPLSDANKLPGIGLIPVNRKGENQIFVLPGVCDDFNNDDIDAARSMIESASKRAGILVVALECPLSTAMHAIELAKKYGLRVILDPGGIEPNVDLANLLSAGIFLIKPNEHEARQLTGVEVNDISSAGKAADKLMSYGIENVLITVGVGGAYLFTESVRIHIPVPKLRYSRVTDSTGCGDQTIAAICTFIQEGMELTKAVKFAVWAGSLQFHRQGIIPITRKELLT